MHNPKLEILGCDTFPFSHFSIQISNMTQVKFKWGFKHTFQFKRNEQIVGWLSKNKFHNFLNSFIFKFSFLSLQSHFQTYFQKQFKPFQILIQTTQSINQMLRHVCTTMLLPYDQF